MNRTNRNKQRRYYDRIIIFKFEKRPEKLTRPLSIFKYRTVEERKILQVRQKQNLEHKRLHIDYLKDCREDKFTPKAIFEFKPVFYKGKVDLALSWEHNDRRVKKVRVNVTRRTLKHVIRLRKRNAIEKLKQKLKYYKIEKNKILKNIDYIGERSYLSNWNHNHNRYINAIFKPEGETCAHPKLLDNFIKTNDVKNKIYEIRTYRKRRARLLDLDVLNDKSKDFVTRQIEGNPLGISSNTKFFKKTKKSTFIKNIVNRTHPFLSKRTKLTGFKIRRRYSKDTVFETLRELEQEEKKFKKGNIHHIVLQHRKELDIKESLETGVPLPLTEQDLRKLEIRRQLIKQFNGHGDNWDCLNWSLIQQNKIIKEAYKLFREQRDRELFDEESDNDDWYLF